MARREGWDQQQEHYWDRQGGRRSPTHPVVEGFARPKVTYLFSVIAQHAAGADMRTWSVLDVGCGNGYWTYYLSQRATTTGIDFSPTMLRQNPCSRLVCASALHLPFADRTFDLVVCSNLLHHLERPAKAVREMARVSRGYVALSEPNCRHPAMAVFHAIKTEERGALKFNRNYMQRLLAEANLHEVAVSVQGSVLPNMCPMALLPFVRPLDRVPFFRLYCIVIGAVRT